MIRLARRLDIRSMIRAKATTEHKSKGQIGQPAAGMIENKVVPVEESGPKRRPRDGR